MLGDKQYEGVLIAGQRRLLAAKEFFDTKLKELLGDAAATEQFARLCELQRRITDGLAFLVYEVRSDAEVGVIFETLNERGRNLTDLEKIKNYLLYLSSAIPDDRGVCLSELISHAWHDMFLNLAEQPDGAEDQLLRAHWLATQNPDPRLWKRVASVKEQFERSAYVPGGDRIIPYQTSEAAQEDSWARLKTDVEDYVHSLRNCSTFLADMSNPRAKYDNFTAETDRRQARLRTEALGRSGVVAPYRSLLFAARLKYPSDGSFYARLVDLCERFSARVFVIEQARSTAGEPRLARLAADLYKGVLTPSQVLARLETTIWEYANDDAVRNTLEDTSKNWYRRPGHKYFLYEYELSLIAPGAEAPDFSTFTREGGRRRPRSTSSRKTRRKMRSAGGTIFLRRSLRRSYIP